MWVVPVEGYASVFNVRDAQNDRVCPGAFRQTLAGSSKPGMLWQHDIRSPIGRWTRLQEDGRGLHVHGELFLSLPRGFEAWILVRKQALDGLSVGFQVRKAVRCPRTGVRDLHQIDLVEISLVTLAAARPWTVLHHGPPVREGNMPDERLSSDRSTYL